MRYFKLDLFLKLGSHLGSPGDARRDDTLGFAAESRAQSLSAVRLSRFVFAAAISGGRVHFAQEFGRQCAARAVPIANRQRRSRKRSLGL